MVIGVTGHRDLIEGDRYDLEKQVRNIFEEIGKNYPHTPMVLLSPLAEGADRLVVRVALDLGIHLIVPLPMPRTLYERDFQTPDSQTEFNDLIQRAENWFELPLVEGNTEGNIREYGKHRDLQYEAVGKFIVHHSQILIALWDGESSDLLGGTAQIVQYWLKDFPQSIGSMLSPPDPVKCGPLYHIMTPRIKNPNPDKAKTYQKIFPEGYSNNEEAERDYKRIYKSIESFNRDALNFESELAAKRGASKAYLIPGLEAETLSYDLKFIREVYTTADTLALYFQGKTLWTLKALCILALAAVAFFEAYSHMFHDTHILLLLYPVLLGVAFFFYYRAKQNEYQNKYQDYRAIAEGLRVQFFWRLADLPTSVEEHYLGKQRSELDWIRSAIRVCWSITGGEVNNTISSGIAPQDIHRMQLVLKHWVENQYTYFNEAGWRDGGQLKSIEQKRNLLLLLSVGLTFIMAVILTLLGFLFKPNLNKWLEQNRLIHGLLLFIIVSLPAVIAAVLYTYAEKKALSAQTKQYAAMKILFDKARGRLRDLVDLGRYDAARYKESQILVEELGKKALEENGDWVLMHRERPLDIPR